MIERRFELKGGGELLLSVDPPRPDGKSFRCDYRIRHPDGVREAYGMGADSLQALILGLQRAHIDLLSSPTGRAGEIMWLGQRSLGLPLPSNVTADDYLDPPPTRGDGPKG
jgi:hypothetical protein